MKSRDDFKSSRVALQGEIGRPTDRSNLVSIGQLKHRDTQRDVCKARMGLRPFERLESALQAM